MIEIIKYMQITYNGGQVVIIKYKDYLMNIVYWNKVVSLKEIIYK
jgi:hypothetical protein